MDLNETWVKINGPLMHLTLKKMWFEKNETMNKLSAISLLGHSNTSFQRMKYNQITNKHSNLS